jgi:hypothetical protein
MVKQKENKMGVMPIGKLIFTMSIPMIISMLVQAVYNIVDSIFVAHYSNIALSAVNYSFPAQNLMIGVATGTGVGVNALLSRSLGEKNPDKANKVAANGVLLAMFGYLIFLIFGIFGSRWFIAFQTKDAAIIEAGYQYLSTCCIFSFGIFGKPLVFGHNAVFKGAFGHKVEKFIKLFCGYRGRNFQELVYRLGQGEKDIFLLKQRQNTVCLTRILDSHTQEKRFLMRIKRFKRHFVVIIVRQSDRKLGKIV